MLSLFLTVLFGFFFSPLLQVKQLQRLCSEHQQVWCWKSRGDRHTVRKALPPAWRLVRAVMINPGCKVTPLTFSPAWARDILALERSPSLCDPIDSEDLSSFGHSDQLPSALYCPEHCSLNSKHKLSALLGFWLKGKYRNTWNLISGVAYITKNDRIFSIKCLDIFLILGACFVSPCLRVPITNVEMLSGKTCNLLK